jgi:ubiquitin-protein ligase
MSYYEDLLNEAKSHQPKVRVVTRQFYEDNLETVDPEEFKRRNYEKNLQTLDPEEYKKRKEMDEKKEKNLKKKKEKETVNLRKMLKQKREEDIQIERVHKEKEIESKSLEVIRLQDLKKISSSFYKETSSKRLLKDLLEVKKNPLPTINVEPLENNLYEWHGNIYGTEKTPFENGVFHVIMKFPNEYPLKPPKVNVSPKIPRDHIFTTWICLDMLETHYTNELYSGWSSVYTVLSILIQLQSYLFSTEDSKKYPKESYVKCVSDSLKYSCEICGHDMNNNIIYPKLPVVDKFDKKKKSKEITEKFPSLPLDIIIKILLFLDYEDINKVKMVPELYKTCQPIIYRNLNKSETICFFSKESFETQIIGVGITIDYNQFNQTINYIYSPLELLGYDSYLKLNLRKGVWR